MEDNYSLKQKSTWWNTKTKDSYEVNYWNPLSTTKPNNKKKNAAQ